MFLVVDKAYREQLSERLQQLVFYRKKKTRKWNGLAVRVELKDAEGRIILDTALKLKMRAKFQSKTPVGCLTFTAVVDPYLTYNQRSTIDTPRIHGDLHGLTT